MKRIAAIEALSDATRRRIFEHLRRGPCSVNELVAIARVSQPAVSQHLRVLKKARLVVANKHGRQQIYRLEAAGLAELRTYVESFWDQALASFQEAAGKIAKKEIDHGTK